MESGPEWDEEGIHGGLEGDGPAWGVRPMQSAEDMPWKSGLAQGQSPHRVS